MSWQDRHIISCNEQRAALKISLALFELVLLLRENSRDFSGQAITLWFTRIEGKLLSYTICKDVCTCNYFPFNILRCYKSAQTYNITPHNHFKTHLNCFTFIWLCEFVNNSHEPSLWLCPLCKFKITPTFKLMKAMVDWKNGKLYLKKKVFKKS